MLKDKNILFWAGLPYDMASIASSWARTDSLWAPTCTFRPTRLRPAACNSLAFIRHVPPK